jgi:hypothetical protein
VSRIQGQQIYRNYGTLPKWRIKMADYSFVRYDGKVCGIWLKDPSNLDKPGLVEVLLVNGGAPQLLSDYTSKRYRKVPNNYDSKGGCFVMFGSEKAPGELADAEVSKLESPSLIQEKVKSKRRWQFWK